jgi:hypothetical protein
VSWKNGCIKGEQQYMMGILLSESAKADDFG